MNSGSYPRDITIGPTTILPDKKEYHPLFGHAFRKRYHFFTHCSKPELRSLRIFPKQVRLGGMPKGTMNSQGILLTDLLFQKTSQRSISFHVVSSSPWVD